MGIDQGGGGRHSEPASFISISLSLRSQSATEHRGVSKRSLGRLGGGIIPGLGVAWTVVDGWMDGWMDGTGAS